MTDSTETRERPETLAVCSCGAPLIPTFLFSHKEYYCLECGRMYEFFDSFDRKKNTDNLDARLRALKKEFAEIAEPIITPFSKLTDCDRCQNGQGYHHEHATDEERMASSAALKRLKERITVAR